MSSDSDLRNGVVSAALDTLPVSVAIIDDSATIVWTNQTWDAFGEANSAAFEDISVGVNYLDAAEDSDEFGQRAIEGLRALLDGDREEFSMEYPCHSPTDERWFLMWATRFETGGQCYVTVAHFDITDRTLAERQLAEQTEEVSRQRDHLTLLNQIVRHDIRNDVQLVLTHAELLAEGVPEEDREHVDRVLQQTAHIVDLTEVVRNLAEVITDDAEPD